MAKEPTPKKRLKLADMRRERAEALGGEYFELEGLDGTVAELPRSGFWDGDTYEAWLNDRASVSDMSMLEACLPPDKFEQVKAMGLQLGDVREVTEELLRTVKAPESQGSSTP